MTPNCSEAAVTARIQTIADAGVTVVLVVSATSSIRDVETSLEFVALTADLVSAGWERRHLERELMESERRMVEAQELAHMGTYDWNIVTDENVWSDELYRIYGYGPQSFNASYERFLGMLHPDERERIMGVHQQAHASLEPDSIRERIVRPDGTERVLASTGQVIADDHGHPVRMRGVCIDIADRLRVESEIQRLDQAEQRRRRATLRWSRRIGYQTARASSSNAAATRRPPSASAPSS
jgi:PAS domain S-box-containing protein